MDVAEVRMKIDEIIERRHQTLPAIDANTSEINDQLASLRGLLVDLDNLRSLEKDSDALASIAEAKRSLEFFIEHLTKRIASLNELKAEFTRNTLNIGVSGEARVGKSTTLQRITGLSDVQIPTGKGLPVTAVRSEIYNDSNERAEIVFRDAHSFVHEYLQPLLDSINERLDKPIRIVSLSDLRDVNFPDNLGDNVSTTAANSLKKLKEAQRGYSTYADLLHGLKKTVDLADLRKYVAYPTDEEEIREEKEGIPANRAYLAVKEAMIFCRFPGLDGARIGLVDLPGLGEIGKDVEELHLKGLEEKIDQIFLIMKPDITKGFVGNVTAQNIDLLRIIQPGVRMRSDLISFGINVFPGTESTSETLQHDIERNINAAQKTDKYEILHYVASDEESVASLFMHLLEKLSSRLPDMDQQKLEYVLGEESLDEEITRALEMLNLALDRILRRIPSPPKLMSERINIVSRSIIDAYNKYEVKLLESSSKESEIHKQFAKEVERIYDDVKKEINAGLFKGSWAKWEDEAHGQVDYYSYYRAEARRLRREIIDKYSGLDVFYEASVSDFKRRVLFLLLENAGRLQDYFAFSENDTSQGCIDKVASELGGTIKDKDMLDALNLLQNVSFSFRSNAFLEIESHLANLANPDDVVSKRVKGTGYKAEIEVVTKKDTLGGVENVEGKIKKAKGYLTDDANSANDSIREALLGHDDKFNRYLSICISFFIDFLFRKNEENFKQVVVRSLILEYPDYFFEGEDALGIDPRKAVITSLKESIQKMKPENRLTGTKKAGKVRQSTWFAQDEESGSSKGQYDKQTKTKQEWAKQFKEGTTIEGVINGIQPYGAFVGLGEYSGLIHVSELANHQVDDPSDEVAVGERVTAKIISVDIEKGYVNLSLKSAN